MDSLLLQEYMDCKVNPILIRDELYEEISNLGETIDSTCSLDLLNGSYENDKFIPPEWYDNAREKKLLFIRNIDSIPVNEQIKFMEIFLPDSLI